ncbi:SchA/CurD-like domain-containing protein [Actinosynnema sp. NPDC051121]
MTFPVKPGSESAVADIMANYRGPATAAVRQPSRPLLDRTSVFMAGTHVVRLVDIHCAPIEAARHLRSQPQIQAVETLLQPHLLHGRDLSDESGLRRFLASAVMRVRVARPAPTSRTRRHATLYRAAPGRGRDLVALLASRFPDDASGVTLCRRRDLVIQVVETDGQPPGPLGAETDLVSGVTPMALLTDRAAGPRT